MPTLFGRDLLAPIEVQPISTGLATEAGPVAVRRTTPPPGRTGPGLAISVAAHIALAALALYLNGVQQPRTPTPATRMAPRLVALVHLPPMPLDLPALPKPAPAPPAKVEIRTEEPRPELPTPLPPNPIENRVAAVAPPPEMRPVEALPKPTPPKPAAPAVVVGAFANNAVVRTPEANREIEKVAFDAPSAKATQPKTAATTVGGFDRPVDANTKPDSPRQVDAVVAETAFGRAPAAAPPAPAARTVRDTGFGNSLSRENPKMAEPPAAVAPSGFASARDVQAAAKAAAPPPVRLIPVEVLSKPNPAYTDEARQLKIEGEVLLEVNFSATGSLTVVRVVRGLGYGLDEAAIQAARQIKFKPAQDGGRPVDSRATVHIVFRLA